MSYHDQLPPEDNNRLNPLDCIAVVFFILLIVWAAAQDVSIN